MVNIIWFREEDMDTFNDRYNNYEVFKNFVDSCGYIEVSQVLGSYPVYTDLSRSIGMVLRSDFKRMDNYKIKVRVNNIEDMKDFGCHVYTGKEYESESKFWSVNNRTLKDIYRYIGLNTAVIIIPEIFYPGIIDLGKWVVLIAPRIFNSFLEEKMDDFEITEMNDEISLDDLW